MEDEAGQPRRTWIFQGNPNKYRLEDSLTTEQEEYWNLNQHAKSVRCGDRVLIWISGDAAGIYAIGRVMTNPQIQSDSPIGLNYWNNRADGLKPKARVLVRYERLLFHQPLRKAYFQADPDLWDMTILHAPRATNFSVTADEWRAIRTWLDENPDDG